MGLKKLSPNEKCGCGSGLKYKKCCWPTGDAWFIDERGIVVDSEIAKLTPIARRVASDIFRSKFGAPLRTLGDQNILASSLSQIEMADLLHGVGSDRGTIYAYETTSLLIPDAYVHFLRLTNIIPIPMDRREADLEKGLRWVIEYDRVAGGDDVVDPERATLEEIMERGKNHTPGIDNSPVDHMMRRTSGRWLTPASCPGCKVMAALTELLLLPEDEVYLAELLIGTRWWKRDEMRNGLVGLMQQAGLMVEISEDV